MEKLKNSHANILCVEVDVNSNLMECVNPRSIYVRDKHVIVPCGKCIACLSNKRNDWTFRLTEEHKVSKSALFVTLTYDWKHCPTDGSVNKRDPQLFLKRLRKRDGTNRIRYYLTAEYGTKGGRPHYHVLLFNCNERDVRASWTLGIVHVGTVTLASVAYVTKYIVQPDSLPSTKQTRPFALMSRAYGIGAHYLSDDMVSWHRSGDKNYTIVNGNKVRLPRYYRDKIWYRDLDKSRVSLQSKRFALDQKYKQEKELKSIFGEEWQTKYKEMRNAVLLRIKSKVAFTQTF